MNIRGAIRSLWGWFFLGQEPDSVSDQSKVAPPPAPDTARPLSAANDYELSAALGRSARPARLSHG